MVGKSWKRPVCCGAVFGLAVASSVLDAPSASAVVEKTGGSISCSGGAKAGVQGKGSGQLNWYVPRTGSQVYYANHNSLILTSTYRSPGTSISSWRVTSTGGVLDDAGTKAVCIPPTVSPPQMAG